MSEYQRINKIIDDIMIACEKARKEIEDLKIESDKLPKITVNPNYK